jgi:hypothetical protein
MSVSMKLIFTNCVFTVFQHHESDLHTGLHCSNVDLSFHVVIAVCSNVGNLHLVIALCSIVLM